MSKGWSAPAELNQQREGQLRRKQIALSADPEICGIFNSGPELLISAVKVGYRYLDWENGTYFFICAFYTYIWIMDKCMGLIYEKSFV